MRTIHIEKYVDGVRQEAITLPLAPLRFLVGLLPQRARRELERQGLDLQALFDDTPAPLTQWMDVKEKGLAKRIRITRGG
jgi:hypothetical protein